jgi:hypothetical protein
MVLNLYWSNLYNNETGVAIGISVKKDILMRVLYLLFSIMAISSFVTIAKENKKTKAPLTQLLFPSFLIILPVLILFGQVVSLVNVWFGG